jgi:GDP-L-fucose synthase
MMENHDKIYVAGHRGMVGSSIVRLLKKNGYSNILTRTSAEVDLRDQTAVENFFSSEKPDYVFLAAAKVGGILANNNYRGEFIYDNLMIEANIIHQAYLHQVKKLLFLGSSCIYPKLARQPLHEDYLLTGPLETTNQSYAIAKIAGIEICKAYRVQYGCNFISVMPTNLYGPNDNYDPEKSHVLPALLRKFIIAQKENYPYVEIWGTGIPKREFLYVDDLADACIFLMETYNEADIINIGVGEDISILKLAQLIANITGYKGEIKFDTTKPDGTLRKLLDVSKLKLLGWRASVPLELGIKKVYEELITNEVFA